MTGVQTCALPIFSILFKADGTIASIYRDEDRAKATAERYNANPVVESTGEPDTDAPYKVVTWGFIDDPR